MPKRLAQETSTGRAQIAADGGGTIPARYFHIEKHRQTASLHRTRRCHTITTVIATIIATITTTRTVNTVAETYNRTSKKATSKKKRARYSKGASTTKKYNRNKKTPFFVERLSAGKYRNHSVSFREARQVLVSEELRQGAFVRVLSGRVREDIQHYKLQRRMTSGLLLVIST